MRVLVVEDQPEMNALLVRQLSDAHYSVDGCLNGNDALDYLAGVTVQGDETLLMRLFINLLENGIRYGRPGGWLKLTLRREGDAAVAVVADNGIGIAPENLDHIWQRFWQADPARSGGGAGLGLAMVRWIAEAHGGTVTVESTPGEGSAFTFTMPLLS